MSINKTLSRMMSGKEALIFQSKILYVPSSNSLHCFLLVVDACANHYIVTYTTLTKTKSHYLKNNYSNYSNKETDKKQTQKLNTTIESRI